MSSKTKRLSEKITRKTKDLNDLMKEAHKMDLMVQAVLDVRQLPFPILDIRLMKEI